VSSSAETGLMSMLNHFASYRKGPSFIVSSKALRRASTLSLGTPGGVAHRAPLLERWAPMTIFLSKASRSKASRIFCRGDRRHETRM